MSNIQTVEKIEKIKILLKDLINLSKINEDTIIQRTQTGLSCEHLISLAQVITKKLQDIDKDFDTLINRIK